MTFILKEPKSTQSTILYCLVRHENERIKVSTGIKTLPAKWDAQKQRMNRKASLLEQSANAVVDRYRMEFDVYMAEINREGVGFSLLGFRERLKNSGKPKVKGEENLLRFAREFIAEVNRRPETIKGYNQTLNRLSDYAHHRKIKFNFEEVDLSLLNDLVRYFEEERGFALNTIHLHIKNLKVFMKEAKERGLHSNAAHESRRFTVKTEDTPKVYLSEEELNLIRRVDLSQNVRLERVRDLFLIHVNTGVRYSDLHKINNSNFLEDEGGKLFQIRQEKTSAFLWIPVLHPEVISILDRYEGHSPGESQKGRFLSNQKYNAYLKEVARLAGILGKFTSFQTKGGKREERVQYKANLICSHTARRSFATNAYKKGLPISSIMQITGHKTESSFRKYIQLSGKEHALELIKRNDLGGQGQSAVMRTA